MSDRVEQVSGGVGLAGVLLDHRAERGEVLTDIRRRGGVQLRHWGLPFRRDGYWAVNPPSTTRSAPVTNFASSLAR